MSVAVAEDYVGQVPHSVDGLSVTASEWSWLMVELVDEISSTAMLLGHAMRMHADARRGDSIFPTVATLAGMIGKSRSVVHRALKELQGVGLIEAYDTAASGAVVYRLVRPEGVQSRRRHLAVVDACVVHETGGVSSTTHNQAIDLEEEEEEVRGHASDDPGPDPVETRLDAGVLVWQAADTLGARPKDLKQGYDDLVDSVARLLVAGVSEDDVFGRLVAAPAPGRVRTWVGLLIGRLGPLGGYGTTPHPLTL